MSSIAIESLQEELKEKSALEILKAVADKFKGKITLASSLGAEDQVITDLIAKNNLDIEIFTLDTGRVFQESYDLLSDTEKKYDLKVKIFFPEREDVEKMVSENGINLFYDSIENRKQCCRIRKMVPLARALAPHDAWVCGLRKDQSVTREDMCEAEIDANHNMIKINPLINWSEEDVWNYIKENNIPYNKLHDQGFLSIGCAPCTRAVKEGEDVRAGRWWWESPEQKECGLHFVDGKMVRTKDLKK